MNLIETLRPKRITSEEEEASIEQWLDQSNHGVGLEKTVKISPSRHHTSQGSIPAREDFPLHALEEKYPQLGKSRARSFPWVGVAEEQPSQEVAVPAHKWQYFDEEQWAAIDSEIAADLSKMHFGS